MSTNSRSRLLRTTAVAVVLGCGPHLAIAQETDTILLEPIVIQAGRQAENSYVAPTTIGRTEADPVDVPLTVTTFTADRIEDQDIRTDVELLQQTPGVDITSLEGFNRVRGYDAQYAIDGVPVGNFVERTSADLSAFEQVGHSGHPDLFRGCGLDCSVGPDLPKADHSPSISIGVPFATSDQISRISALVTAIASFARAVYPGT